VPDGQLPSARVMLAATAGDWDKTAIAMTGIKRNNLFFIKSSFFLL
jgi:hypothetical protein